MVSIVLYICTVNPGNTLASVEVALTILKLTGTDRQADGRAGTSKYGVIGKNAHPTPVNTFCLQRPRAEYTLCWDQLQMNGHQSSVFFPALLMSVDAD